MPSWQQPPRDICSYLYSSCHSHDPPETAVSGNSHGQNLPFGGGKPGGDRADGRGGGGETEEEEGAKHMQHTCFLMD